MDNDPQDNIDDEILSIIGTPEENPNQEKTSQSSQTPESEQLQTANLESQEINKEKLDRYLKHLATTKNSYNRKSFYWGIPGIILHITGLVMFMHYLSQLDMTTYHQEPLHINFVMLLGFILLLVGFAYYAKMKGRSRAWCLVAFLGIIGLVILACLKDKFVLIPEYIKKTYSPSTIATLVCAKTSGLAIASFILGFLSIFLSFLLLFVPGLILVILGLILGILALIKIRRSAGKLQGLVYAITGIVLSCVGGFVFIVMVIGFLQIK